MIKLLNDSYFPFFYQTTKIKEEPVDQDSDAIEIIENITPAVKKENVIAFEKQEESASNETIPYDDMTDMSNYDENIGVSYIECHDSNFFSF